MSFQSLTLEMKSSCDLGMKSCWGLTAMPRSGEVVRWGQVSLRDPHVIYTFGQVGGKLQKLREVKATCQHFAVIGLLGVVVERKELLAVVCFWCGDVKLGGNRGNR